MVQIKPVTFCSFVVNVTPRPPLPAECVFMKFQLFLSLFSLFLTLGYWQVANSLGGITFLQLDIRATDRIGATKFSRVMAWLHNCEGVCVLKVKAVNFYFVHCCCHFESGLRAIRRQTTNLELISSYSKSGWHCEASNYHHLNSFSKFREKRHCH